MLLYAAQHGAERDGARLALLLQERGLGGRGEDLAARLERWNGDRSARAEASRKLAERWARAARGLVETHTQSQPPLAVLLAEGFPDNLSRRRSPTGEEWLAAGGRGLRLDPASSLSRAEWLAVGEAQGEAKGARITGAIALTEGEVTRWLPHRLQRRTALRWVADERRVEALLETRLGAITLARGSDPAPDPDQVRAFLCERLRGDGLDLLPWSPASQALLRRARYAGVDALTEEALRAAPPGPGSR